MHAVVALVNRLVAGDDGQDLVEYGVLVVLIAILAIAGISFVGQAVNAVLWQPIANNL